MANKKGKSEKKTTFFGKSYIQHYDSKGNKSGRSEKKTGFFGNTYSQHYNSKNEKSGRSEKKETWLGSTYTQKYNSKGEKSGKSEKKETWLGKRYTQHSDTKGKKTDWTEHKETFFGKPYVQRYGETTAPPPLSQSSSRYSSTSGSSGAYGSNYGSTGSSNHASSNTSTRSSSAGPAAVVVILIGVVLLVGLASLVGNLKNRSSVASNRTQPMGTAYINTTQLNMRRGPGTQYDVVTRLSRGEAVACLQKSENQHGESWVHIQRGSYDGWVNEEYLSQAPPLSLQTPLSAPSPSATQEVRNNVAQTANVRAVEPPFVASTIRFFESGNNTTPYGQRFYAVRFAASQSRFIYWELYTVHAKPHERTDFTIHAIWRRAEAGILGEQDAPSYFESNQNSSYRGLGWGRETPGWWTPGTYTVELYFQNTKIATRSFEIY